MRSSSICKLSSFPQKRLIRPLSLTVDSTSDDAALRFKVDEAMNVWNEYMKVNSKGESSKEDGNKENVRDEKV